MRALARILSFITIFILTLSTIPTTFGEEPVDETAEWTFMVYLDSDNNLESAGIEDINEMETAGSTNDVNIVVQMDRCASGDYDSSNGDWTGAKRFYVTQDQDMDTINSEEIMDLGEVNMGDPVTLTNFTNWAIDNYPAKKYALVLWNHGGAFWGVCWDEDNEDDCITMPELKAALERIEAHLGRDLDLIGFDACLMAQVAVMYQIRNSVDIGVGSGYTEPGEGWPYEMILPKLVKDPQMSPMELGTIIADEYVASYTDREQDPDDTTAVTQVVLDLEKFDILANKIDILSMILSTKTGLSPSPDDILGTGKFIQIQQARSDTNSYDFATQVFPGNQQPIDPTGYCMYDVIDLMDNLQNYLPFDSEVYAAAEAVKSAASDSILHFAVNPYHGEVKGAHGLTLYFPSGSDTTYSEAFDETDFAMDMYWDDFLFHYYAKENAEDTPPCVFIRAPKDDEVMDRGKSNELTINGTAFDAQDEISLIEIKIDDGEWVPVGASAKWHHDLPLSGLENGNHTIYARSFDGNSYSAEDSVKILIVEEAAQPEHPYSPSFLSPSFLIMILVVIVILSVLFILRKRNKASKLTS